MCTYLYLPWCTLLTLPPAAGVILVYTTSDIAPHEYYLNVTQPGGGISWYTLILQQPQFADGLETGAGRRRWQAAWEEGGG